MSLSKSDGRVSVLEWTVLFSHSRFGELVMGLLAMNTGLWVTINPDAFVGQPFYQMASQITTGEALGVWLVLCSFLHLSGLLSKTGIIWRRMGALFNYLNYLFLSVTTLFSPFEPSAVEFWLLTVFWLLVYLRMQREVNLD